MVYTRPRPLLELRGNQVETLNPGSDVYVYLGPNPPTDPVVGGPQT